MTFKCPEMTNSWGSPRLGKGTQVGAFVEIGHGVEIGKRCTIGAYVFIPPGVVIRDDVWIGPRVTFTNDKYPPSTELGHILLLDRVVIGAGVVILPKVVIGVNTMVGAGAVVTKHIWGGTFVRNPARLLCVQS